MTVTVTGQKELAAALQQIGRGDILRAADRGLKQAGLSIIADAQVNLRHNHTNTTGRLSQSGRVQRVPLEGGYDVGFMMGEQNYAGAVEYGRRAGGMPPVDAIRAWLRKKHSGRNSALRAAAAFTGRSQDRLLTSSAWAIAKSIAKSGTRPHPFFTPAVNKNHARIVREVRDAIVQVLNRPNYV